MSTGHGLWETRFDLGLQADSGTTATVFYKYCMEDSDGLSSNPQNIDRYPTCGGRTRPEQSYRKDHLLPGGDGPGWAAMYDENMLGLLHMLNFHFQNYSMVSGGTGAPDDWTFSPLAEHAVITDLEPYSIRKIVATGATGATLGGAEDETYTDCIANGLAVSWSLSNPLVIKPTGVKALTIGYSDITGAGTALTGYEIATPEISLEMDYAGTTYDVYAASFTANHDNGLENKAAIGVAQGARLVFGKYRGDLTFQTPRDRIPSLVRTQYDNNTVGTMRAEVRPSEGTYSSGGGALQNDMIWYVKFDKPANPTGGDGEAMTDITAQILDCSFTLKSELGTLTGT